MLATVLLITHVKNKEIESAKNLINAFKSQEVLFFLSQKLLPFHCADFGHFNSYSFKFNSEIRNHVPRYWIWMNSYWNVRSLRGGKGAVSVILERGLVVIWRHLSYFWHFRFLCFLTWVMRRTVANINPTIIHFDAVDFSGHHSKKYKFLLTLSVVATTTFGDLVVATLVNSRLKILFL